MIKDAYFVVLTGGLWLAAFSLYAVRVVARGAHRSERVAQIGGTALVGQEIMDATYRAVEPVTRALVRLGITANAVTWTSLVLGLGAGVALAVGWFGLACMLATASTMLDILDGQVARYRQTGSPRGELLDAVVDRYTELAFVGGLVLYLRDSAPLMVLALAALNACFMVSYASAKAEALHVTVPRGLMRRHERAVYLITGAGLTSALGGTIHSQWPALPTLTPMLIGLAVVAVIGNVAAITRLVRIMRQLATRDAAA